MCKRFTHSRWMFNRTRVFELLIITRVYLLTVAGRYYQKLAQQYSFFFIHLCQAGLARQLTADLSTNTPSFKTVTVSGSEEVTRARELLRKEKLFKLCETLCDKFLGSVKHFILTATR